MRPFNEREKEIIRELVKIDSKTYNNSSRELVNSLLENNLKGCGIALDFVNKIAYLIYPKNKREKEIDNVRNIYELLSLMIYLESNRYISIFKSQLPPDFAISDYYTYGINIEIKSSPSENKDEIRPPLAKKDEKDTHSPSELEGESFKLVVHFFNSFIYVSEELKYIERNNFKTIEEIRFSKQQILTIIGLCLAFLGTLAAFLVPFFTSK